MRKPGPKQKEIDLDRVRECAALGIAEEAIARLVGVSPSTWFDRKNSNPEILDALKMGRAIGQEKLLKKMTQMAELGNVPLMIFMAKSIYGLKESATSIEVSGTNGSPLAVEHVLLTHEERKKKLEELKMLTEAMDEEY